MTNCKGRCIAWRSLFDVVGRTMVDSAEPFNLMPMPASSRSHMLVRPASR
jgi:hypothetical protein